MAESYQTEEEQLEALQRWWDENGKSTIATIALALGVGFGWQYWQGQQQERSEVASGVYQDMLEAVSNAGENPELLATGRNLAETLKTDYPGTTYAQFAALHLAKLAVARDDLAAAEQELR